MFLVVAVCTGFMFMWRATPQAGGPQVAPATTRQGDPTKKSYTRAEFSRLLMGTKPDEVIAAVGKPNDTTENAQKPDSPIWYYERVTIDPITGKLDFNAQVVFEKGVVSTVNY